MQSDTVTLSEAIHRLDLSMPELQECDLDLNVKLLLQENPDRAPAEIKRILVGVAA